MQMHSDYTCEDHPDCPDLADHWVNECWENLDVLQTAVDAAYFLAFILGDHSP
jgi:hypothetical protein